MKIPVESRFHSDKSWLQRHSSSKASARIAAHIQEPAGRLSTLAVRGSRKRSTKNSKKKSNAMLRCDCQHAKSIHSRMYANQKLGTSCNFPGCKCKAYNPVRHSLRP